MSVQLLVAWHKHSHVIMKYRMETVITRDVNEVDLHVYADVNEFIDCDDVDSFVNPDKVDNVMKFNVNDTGSLIDKQKIDATLKSSLLHVKAKVDL